MRTRLGLVVGSVACLCACMGTPPAEVEQVEPAAATEPTEVDRTVAPEDELPRGECEAVPKGMRRVDVPLNHSLEHLERGDHVDVAFVAELRGQKIQREDMIAMPLISNARVACVREQALELLVFPEEVPLLAASRSYGTFYAVERAEGDTESRLGLPHAKRNTLIEHYISHWSEAPHATQHPITLHSPRGERYGLEKLDAFAPGTVRFTLGLADPARVAPGQRVDVILGAEVPSLQVGSKRMEPAGIVFAQMARVEASGDASVSLLVTPELALALALADGLGTWSLSVRPDGDAEVVKYDDVRLKEHLMTLEEVGARRSKSP